MRELNKKPGKVYVWPFCTRIVHWMIAISFTLSFISSYYEHLLNFHVALGFIFGMMLTYRIIWGIVGPQYATFNTFMLKISDLEDYFLEKIRNRWREIPAGHNPASSWYTIIVLSVGYVIVTSGLLLYGVQEGKGYFSFLNEEYYLYMHALSDIHIYSSYTLLTWAVIHIVGVLIEQFYHKTSMVFAMITGYKKAKGKDTKLKRIENFLTYTIILMTLWSFFAVTEGKHNPIVASKYHPIDYSEENRIVANECGDCHKVYAPYLLPEKSWKRIMKGLKNHFGEEITENNISKPQQIIIEKYLVENCAENSTREAAVKVLESLSGRSPKAITKVKYWRDTHAHIPRSTFKAKPIKDKSNCFACHIDFDKGILEDINIKIPKLIK